MFQRITTLLASLILVFYQLVVHAQNCDEVSFNSGSLNGWKLSYGSYRQLNSQAVYGTEIIGTRDNEHLITNSSMGNDPKITNEAIPQVAPGSKYSCRLGYVVQGGRFDRLQKSFTVTPDNSLFQFSYAILLEQDLQSAHQNFQKPGFSVKIIDEKNNGLKCGEYDIQLQSGKLVDGFKVQKYIRQPSGDNGEVQYRNWTTAAMDLKSYIGKTLTLIVEVHGCTGLGHFGYVYFDAKCLQSEITALSKCPDANGKMKLKGPDGFLKYTWNNGQVGQIGTVNATLGGTYSAQIRPFTSNSDECDFTLNYKIKYGAAAATVNQTICDGEEFKVENKGYKTSGTFVQTISRLGICDSIVTLNLKVVPIPKTEQQKIICEGESVKVGTSEYKISGTFTDAIPRSIKGETIKCDSIVTTTVIVDKALNISLAERFEASLGQKIQLLPSISPQGNYAYKWVPELGLSCSDCPNPWLKPIEPGTYILTVLNSFGRCPQGYKTKINLANSWIEAPAVFTPNDDGINDVFLFIEIKTSKSSTNFKSLIDREQKSLKIKISQPQMQHTVGTVKLPISPLKPQFMFMQLLLRLTLMKSEPHEAQSY